MGPSSTELTGPISKMAGPQELAIIGLMEAIFNLADNGQAFARKLQASSRMTRVFKGLGQLHQAEDQVSILVGYIRKYVKKEAIYGADSERRRSVSTIVDICTFQLKYLSNKIFVRDVSAESHGSNLLSVRKRKEIRNRVNFLRIQTQDLKQLLDYLNNVRPSPPLQMAIPDPPITSIVPRVACNDFVGHEAIMKSLLIHLPKTMQVVLSGDPGVGKSEICLQFARELRAERSQTWIFWVDGQNPQNSFAEIARYLRLPDSEGGLADSIEQWLKRTKEEWIVVVDNVSLGSAMATGRNNLSSLLNSKLGNANNETTVCGNILLSSQGTKIWSQQSRRFKKLPTVSSILVPLLQPEEALKLTQRLLPASLLQKEGLGPLVSLTRCNPRSIKEAVSYIKTEAITIQQYVSDYDKSIKQQRLLTFENDEHPKHDTKDDIHSAASKIARRFLSEKPFAELLILAHSRMDRTGVIKALEKPIQDYAHRLKTQQQSSDNRLPDFIAQHHKKIATLVLEIETPLDIDDCASAESLLNSSTTSFGKFPSCSSSFGSKILNISPASSRRTSWNERQLVISTPSFDDKIRETTREDSMKLEPLFFDSKIFGRLTFEFINALGSLSDPSAISSASKAAARAWEQALGLSICVNYTVEWELTKVLESTFEPDQKLSDVVVINGRADDAEISTCGEYIKRKWPKGLYLLDLLNATQWGQSKSSILYQNDIEVLIKPDPDLERDTQVSTLNPTSSLKVEITVKGPRATQQDTAATLAWLAAAVRYSDNFGLTESRSAITFSLDEDRPRCAIECLPLSRVQNYSEESTCWHALFAHSTVTIGYPFVEETRPGKGLDIPYDLMVRLGKAYVVTERGAGFVLQGFQFTLVPVNSLGYDFGKPGVESAIQWHLESLISNVEHASSPSKPQRQLPAMKCKSLDRFSSYKTRRAFLGWCDKIGINVGTREYSVPVHGAGSPSNPSSTYPDPTTAEIKSNARGAGRAKSVSTVTATLGGGLHGGTGGAGVAMAFGDRRSAAVVEGPQKLRDDLNSKLASNIVLYDTTSRRAWMLPYLSVLLHLVHLRERATTKGKGEKAINLPFADQWSNQNDKSYTASQAAWNRIAPYVRLYEKIQVDSKAAKDFGGEARLQVETATRLVEHLDHLLIVLRAATNQSQEWRKKEMAFFHRSKVYGFELKDIAYADKLRYKQRKLRDTSGGWARMQRDDIGVLFCSNLREAMFPVADGDGHRGHWETLPQDLDYLAAPLSCLSTCDHVDSIPTSPLEEEPVNGSEQKCRNHRFRIRVGNRGHQWGVTRHQFVPSCLNESCSEGTTRLSRHWRSRSECSLISDFRLYMEGAVVFGRSTASSRASKVLKTCKITCQNFGSDFISWIKPKSSLVQSTQTVSVKGERTPPEHVRPLVRQDSRPFHNESPTSSSSTLATEEPSAKGIRILPPPTIPAAPIQPENLERSPVYLTPDRQESTVGTLDRSGTIFSQGRSEERVTPSSSYSEGNVLGDIDCDTDEDLKGIGRWDKNSHKGDSEDMEF